MTGILPSRAKDGDDCCRLCRKRVLAAPSVHSRTSHCEASGQTRFHRWIQWSRWRIWHGSNRRGIVDGESAMPRESMTAATESARACDYTRVFSIPRQRACVTSPHPKHPPTSSQSQFESSKDASSPTPQRKNGLRPQRCTTAQAILWGATVATTSKQ